ncbi:hypothetical protein ACJ41O_004420 [Fusarium nematophilum]
MPKFSMAPRVLKSRCQFPDLEAECAQKIALLRYLGRIASHPERNEAECCLPLPEADADRALSLRDERYLTSTLAFLSSVRDDSNKITAVCVEERPPGMVVMVAANAKGPGVSSAYLASVKHGFDGVFSILREARRISREPLTPRVFGAIVSMCRSRILSRTRIINPDRKPPIEAFLRDVVKGMRKLPLDVDKTSFITLGEKLASIMDKYRVTFSSRSSNSSPPAADKDLESIVQLFYQLSEIPRLEKMLVKDMDRVVPRVNPNACKALLNAIQKLARYREAASSLIKLARRYPDVCKATTQVVTLDDGAFSQVPNSTPRSLTGMLEMLKSHQGTAWDVKEVAERLCSQLRCEPELYEQQLKSMNDPKVHAEIQLCWYLDQHQSQTPPRVIASNKDACYLCNAFISVQRKYIIPRTHGRIYVGWRLPSSGMREASERFLRELERLAVVKISKILSGRVERIECPLESTLSPAVLSGMTILTQDSETPGNLEDPQQLERPSDASDSEETVVPGNSTPRSVHPISNTEPEPLRVGGLDRRDIPGDEATTSSALEQTGAVSQAEEEKPSLTQSPLDKELRSTSPQTIPSPKTQANQTLEQLDGGDLGVDADIQLSAGPVLDQIVSPETHQSRPSSSTSAGSIKAKPSGTVLKGDDDPWKKITRGRGKRIRLSDSLVLYIEYTASPPSASQLLQLKAKRLPDAEAEVALADESPIELVSVKKEIQIQSNRRIKMSHEKQVFVVELDEFVVPMDG